MCCMVTINGYQRARNVEMLEAEDNVVWAADLLPLLYAPETNWKAISLSKAEKISKRPSISTAIVRGEASLADNM